MCGKYRVKMKGEMSAEELRAVKEGKTGESPGGSPAPEEEKKEEEKNDPPAGASLPPGDPPGEEEESGRTGGGLIFVAVILAAVGACWFLWRAYRNRRVENTDDEDFEEVRRYVRA